MKVIRLILVCSWFIKSFVLQKLAVNTITDPIRSDKVMFEVMTFFQVSHSRQPTQITTAKYQISTTLNKSSAVQYTPELQMLDHSSDCSSWITSNCYSSTYTWAEQRKVEMFPQKLNAGHQAIQTQAGCQTASSISSL